MRPKLCPSCEHINSADTSICEACGTDWGEADTQRLPLRPVARVHSIGALWLDELGESRRTPRPADEPSLASRSTTLRETHVPLAPALVVQAPAPDGLVRDATDTTLAADVRADQKATQRAEVRRRRLRRPSGTGGAARITPEVLVLDANDTSRDSLCHLLRAFGFGVHAMSDPAEASALAASRVLVAIFVDMALMTANGGDGIELCSQIREIRQRRDAGASVLVLLAARLRPIDRVRAELAGCDEVILKPVSRGVVARALDARGILLPSDERRI